MNTTPQEAEAAIVGGGLAGLAAAIQLAKAGHRVVLFEKERYPFHKVCGEYISRESWNFLCSLGLPLPEMNLPLIDHLQLTAPNGKAFHTALPLGGFGISRYRMDSALAAIAQQNGVTLLEGVKVEDIAFDGQEFAVRYGSQTLRAPACLAASGKRSNLDVKWNRSFLHGRDKRLDNYIGVKYHLEMEGAAHTIGLHNFEQGYCGISRIEEGRWCLCYMTRADNLKACGNSIPQLEISILSRNPHLEKIFAQARVLQDFPVTISQINFHRKAQVEHHVLMIGDAAGTIAPLCGNGMSIALHTGKIAAAFTADFLKGENSREAMELNYTKAWNRHFAQRLRTGRTLQQFFGSSRLSNGLVRTLSLLPFLAKPIVRMTHGQSF